MISLAELGVVQTKLSIRQHRVFAALICNFYPFCPFLALRDM